MSRVQLRNSGPSYSLVMPLTNIVLSWRTAACLALRNETRFLDLVQCSMLADNIYELVPVDYETMYKLEVSTEADVTPDVMQFLVLLVRAHVVGGSKKVQLDIYARQPHVGWTNFTRMVSNLKRSCKNKERAEVDVVDLPVAKSQVSKFKGTTTDSADFQNQLNCLLRIPRDLSIITPDGQTLSMYEKMLQVDGKSMGRVMGKKAFVNMLESIIIDDSVFGVIANDLADQLEDLDGDILEMLYSAYLMFVLNPEVAELKKKDLTDRLYAILTPSRKIKKQLKKNALDSLPPDERDKRSNAEAALAKKWKSLAMEEAKEKNQRTNPTGVYIKYLKSAEDLAKLKNDLDVKQTEIDVFRDDENYDLPAAQNERNAIEQVIQQKEIEVKSLGEKPERWRELLAEKRNALQAESRQLTESLQALVSNVESQVQNERMALEASLVDDILPYIADQHKQTMTDKKGMSPVAEKFGLSLDRLTLKLFAASGWRRKMYDKIRTSFFGGKPLFRNIQNMDEDELFWKIIERLDKCIEVAYTSRTQAELDLALEGMERAYNTFEKNARAARNKSAALTEARTAWETAQRTFPALSKDDGQSIDFKIARLQQDIIDEISADRTYASQTDKLKQINSERKKASDIYTDFINIRSIRNNKNIKNPNDKIDARTRQWNVLRNSLNLPKNVDQAEVEDAISNIRDQEKKSIEADLNFIKSRSAIDNVLRLRAKVKNVYKEYQAQMDLEQRKWQDTLDFFPECKEKGLDIESTYKGLLPMCEQASNANKDEDKDEDKDAAIDMSGNMSRLIVKLRTMNPEQVTSRLRRRNDIMSLTSDNMSNIKRTMTTRHIFDIGLELAALPAMPKSDMARYFEHEIGQFGEEPAIPRFEDESSMVPPTPAEQSDVNAPSTLPREANEYDGRLVVPATLVEQSEEEISMTPSLELQEERDISPTPKSASQDEEKTEEAEEVSYTRLPIKPERPKPDVLKFFRETRNVEDDSDWDQLEPQAQLAFVLPSIECLWDWMPIRADLILGTYAWVLCKKISSKKDEYTNVIWCKINDTKCHTELNLYRLIAEANGNGPRVLSAFSYRKKDKTDISTDGSTHEYAGFQTHLSDPPTKVERTELRVLAKDVNNKTSYELKSTLVAVASLVYRSEILYFDFDVSGSKRRKGLCTSGSETKLNDVWSRKSSLRDRCERTAWLNYQQLQYRPHCNLSDADTDQILRNSFPFATKEQERVILSYVDQLRDCQKPEVMLNHKNTDGKTRGFKFLACGTYGCSSFWQSTRAGTMSVTNAVTKRMITHTNEYYDTKTKNGVTKNVQSKENRWILTLQREYDMLNKLHEAGVAVRPLSEPVLTGQSLTMLLITKKCDYYPPVGTQYWTFSMEAAKQTVFDFIVCNNLEGNDAKRDALATGIYSIFSRLRAAQLTHGDFHLGNVMYLEDMKTLKLIDTGYSSDVFDPYYDLIAFTVSCADIQVALLRARKNESAAQVKIIQEYVYDKVKSDMLKDGIPKNPTITNIENSNDMEESDGIPNYYPMVTSVADRNKYFHERYEIAVIRKQLVIDGMNWYDALKLPQAAALTREEIVYMIDTYGITRMKEFQRGVLGLIVSKYRQLYKKQDEDFDAREGKFMKDALRR